MESKIQLKGKNPHSTANQISKILLLWSFKLFYKGYRRGLSAEDLCRPREADESAALGDALEAAWRREQSEAKARGRPPSLTRALVRVFWMEYMLCGFFVGILFIVLWPLIPFTLGQFIGYFATNKTKTSYNYAHIHCFLLNLLSVGTSLINNHLFLAQSFVGMRVRVACCSLLYRKILRLDRAGLSRTEPGQVINLMSNDVNRFDMVTLFLHYLWVMPVMVPVCCYLVWQRVQYATLASLAVIVVQSFVVQAYLSNKQGVYRGKIATRTDQRVKVMSELVAGVQVIKMYAWEVPFEKLVALLRKAEVRFIFHTSLIKAFSLALMVFTERFILFVAVATFVLSGHDIRAQTTFALVQYFNLLQLACNIFFPIALAYLAETRVTVQRLEDVLTLDEHAGVEASSDSYMDLMSNGGAEEKGAPRPRAPAPPGLELAAVTASWKQDAIVSTLRGVSLGARAGELVGIAGPVGSGKSSLLQVILGELPVSRGTVALGNAKVSYASQEPWLFVATVRQNILFGLPYNNERYKKVVKACALERDFEQLPGGDGTLVGERGASLSGGQRARVGLARACYRDADIYLLDDPLSAVDAHVGAHLMTECVLGLLGGRVRLLVTHQLHHLRHADKVVVLRNGEVEVVGKYDEVSSSPMFAELLQTDAAASEPASEPAVSAQVSLNSADNIPEDIPNTAEDQVETDELMAKGRVPGSVYRKYFSAGGGWALLLLTALSILAAQVVTSAADLWLTKWMNKVEENYLRVTSLSAPPFSDNDTALAADAPHLEYLTTTEGGDVTQDASDVTPLLAFLTTPAPAHNASVIGTMVRTALTIQQLLDAAQAGVDHRWYIAVWAALIVACVVLTVWRSFLFMWVCMRACINLHNRMFGRVLRATMRFFDTNPSGRVLNRFSKDMGVLDEILPRMYLEAIQITMVMLGILVMVAIANPYMLLTTAACGVLMVLWTILYLGTAQSIKRLEGVTRSPVFSHVTASMAGLTTVRASGAQPMLRKQFDDKQDVHTAAWYLTLVTNTAFSIWLCLISACYVIVVAYAFLLTDKGDTRSGYVGLALSHSLILVNMVQYGIKMITEVVSQMISVERINQYTALPQETAEGSAPPPAWPQRAKVVFKDLYLKYDADSEPVLKNLNIVIESGWKVGVVGRTGAGKSSLIAALFRLAPLDGHIYIDDVDTQSLTLKELRARISIIPQEPVLFSASLRYNLDPFDKYSDAEIWRALEQVELKHSVTSLSNAVEAGGANFSAGERQLLCLARAALAKNKVLVLDEATANVDPNTDALIQKTIRTCFAECTVITVAHRLHTVADADRVLVMDGGQVVEAGHPHVLLQAADGVFAEMVAQLSAPAQRALADLARDAHTKHIRYVDEQP